MSRLRDRNYRTRGVTGGPPGSPFGLPFLGFSEDLEEMLTLKRTFSVSEVLTLGASPIEVVAAQAGYWPYCFVGVLTKDTADVYTGGFGTNLVVAYDTTAHINALAFADAMLGVAAITSRSQVPAFGQYTGEGAADCGGKRLIFTTQSGADPYGGTGSPLTLYLRYLWFPDQKGTMP